MEDIKNSTINDLTNKLKDETSKSDASQKELRRSWATCTPVRATADIWRHFRVYTDNRCPNMAVCLYCRAEVPRGKDRSTTPLRSHLQHHHRDALVEASADSSREDLIGGDYSGKLKREVRFEPTMTLLDSYLKMAIYCHLSLDLCESPCFKRLIKTANPRSTIPDIRTVRQRLHEAEIQVRSLARNNFKGQNFAVSSHTWTSRKAKMYRMFSLQAINDNWEPICLPLNVSSWTSNSDFSEELRKLLQANDYEYSQLSSVVFDSPTCTMSIEPCLGAPSFVCLNHLINRITDIFLGKSEVADAFRMSNQLALNFSENPQEAFKLDQYCRQISVPSLSAFPDKVKSWWSACLHCKRMLDLQMPLRTLSIGSTLALSESDWLIIKTAVLLLEPFMAVYRLLQGEKHVTLSLIPFLVSQVHAGLQFACSSPELPHNFIRVASTMCLELTMCFGKDSSKLLPSPVVMAAALDPRTKLLAGIPQTEHAEVWGKVVIAVRDMVLADIDQARKGSVPHASTKTETGEDTSSHGDGLFALLAGSTSPLTTQFPNIASVPSSEDIVSMAERRASWEVDQYRLAPILAHEEVSRANPLEWYRDRELLFPAVARLARQVLCIPAITCMEMLSEKGIASSEARSLLSDDCMSQYSFLEAAGWPDVLLHLKNISGAESSGTDGGKMLGSKSRRKSIDKMTGRGRGRPLSVVKEELAIGHSSAMAPMKMDMPSSLGIDIDDCLKRKREGNDSITLLKESKEDFRSVDASCIHANDMLIS